MDKHIDEAGLEAAADALHQDGLFHHWFTGPKDWRDIDPLGRSELLGVVERIIRAYLDNAGC
jgi:hypothetical protein